MKSSNSSISKWGGQLQTTERQIRDFMVQELQDIKKITKQQFKVLKIYLAY